MAFLAHIDLIRESDKSAAVKKLISQSTPDSDFFLLIVLSVLMATFGIIIDNIAVVIGSMLIAPIMSSILSLSLGLAMVDYKLIVRSTYTIVKSTVFGVTAAVVATLLFAGGEISQEIISLAEPSLIYFFIALIAGFAVSYTMVDPDLSETFVGFAITVALIPPLSIVGIGIATLDWVVISNSFLLFFINIMGIAISSLFNFKLMHLHKKKKVADIEIKKEEKRVEVEKEKAIDLKEKTVKKDLGEFG